MPKRSLQHQADRRDQILDAAVRCFAGRGYHGATMRDLIADSGLSAGAIYHYFQGKEEILLALCERDLERFRQILAEARREPDPRHALARLVDVFFLGLDTDRVAQDARFGLSTLAEAVVNPTAAAPLRVIQAEWRGELAGRIRDAGLGQPDCSPEALAGALVDLHQGSLAAIALGFAPDAAALAACARRMLGLPTRSQP